MRKLLTSLIFFLLSACEIQASSQGHYFSIFGGLNLLHEAAPHHIHLSTNIGGVSGIALGYKFCPSLRLEGEVSCRFNNIKSGRYKEFHSPITGHSNSLAYMLNGYYAWPMNCVFTPYIGIGAGYAWKIGKFKLLGYNGRIIGRSFASQGILGASYPLFETFEMAVEYRLLAFKHSQNHSLVLNLTEIF